MSEPASIPLSDLVFKIGLFGGILVTYVGLLGVVETGLFRVILGAFVGIASGWILGVLFGAFRGHAPD